MEKGGFLRGFTGEKRQSERFENGAGYGIITERKSPRGPQKRKTGRAEQTKQAKVNVCNYRNWKGKI